MGRLSFEPFTCERCGSRVRDTYPGTPTTRVSEVDPDCCERCGDDVIEAIAQHEARIDEEAPDAE